MSKAFTKEDDAADDDQMDGTSPADLLQGGKNYITPLGAEKLKEELRRLLYDDRPEIVKVVSWAASNGDRSENADYIYGKKRLREIDRRIRFLTKRLDAAEIIDPCAQSSDQVLFGATVTVKDEEGMERVFQIVGIDETDGKRGRISWISPMGKALLKSRVGDVVTVHMPKGEEDLEIVMIRYEKIDG
jgi:transcription elongation factor GreB